ncbi:hypothetical protein V8F20_007785 [Naviculisporaceae sp. PSN 640]
MGKRKKSSRKPQGPKKNEPLPSIFTCLFCNHEKSVSVKLDKKAGVGTLQCKICAQKFQCGINYLSAAVDVYSEWVDAADAVAQEDQAERQNLGSGSRLSSSRPGGSSSRKEIDEYDDEDDDRGGGYGGEGIVDDEEDDYE